MASGLVPKTTNNFKYITYILMIDTIIKVKLQIPKYLFAGLLTSYRAKLVSN
jgi:hypothetical protein